MNADEQAIRALVATWLRATSAGDVDTVLTLMTPDVVFLMPGQPPMTGRDVFERKLRKVLADNTVESVSDVEEVVVVGDLAYCRSKLSVVITSRHGQTPTRQSGYTLSILRKEADGKWRLTRDANLLVLVE